MMQLSIWGHYLNGPAIKNPSIDQNQNWYPRIENRVRLWAPTSILGPRVPVWMLGRPLYKLGHFAYWVQHIHTDNRNFVERIVNLRCMNML